MNYFTVENLVLSLFLAILAAILYIFFMQKSTCALAEKLISSNAKSKESAKTLNELGYKGTLSTAVTGFFAENGSFISKSIVKIKDKSDNESELLFEQKNMTRYYIPEENIDNRFEKHLKDKMSPLRLVIVIVILVAMAAAGSTVIRWLGNYASSVARGESNNAVGVEQEKDTLLEEQEKANKEDELKKKEEEELAKLEEQKKAELEAALGAENENGDGESVSDGLKETEKAEETPDVTE